MTIICDTREKKNGHILEYFDKNGIDYVVKKLDTADYQLCREQSLKNPADSSCVEGKADIVIDRKQNLEELARNLTNKGDKSRFWKEVRRSFRDKIKMIVLCEHSRNITCIEDVGNWHSKFSPVSGKALRDEMYRVHISYGIEFLFCDKKNTGKRIVELLGYE